MIPKKIHYCWFGGAPLPSSARHCINSWKQYLPDYEIIEWNESNFDVNMIPYISEAYNEKKYAYVSDYARFYLLYHHGGVYFDTDVEVIKSMDRLISQGAFMGYEKPDEDKDEHNKYHVNPGLGIACEPGNPLWGAILKKYEEFDNFSLNGGSVCFIVSNCLKRLGIEMNGELHKTDIVTIYPADYLCPKSFYDGKTKLTVNTVSIHHYDMTWFDRHHRWQMKLTHFFSHFLSKKNAETLATHLNNALTYSVRKLRFWK